MKKILVLIPFLVLISCSVQKRKYQNGFYVNWSKSKQQEKKDVIATAKSKANKQPDAKSAVLPVVSEEQTPAPVLEASADKNLTSLRTEKSKKIIQRDEPCDVLVFNDGSEISGKVIEVTATEVKYKKCDMLDGPAYVAKKSNLFMVKYANGTKEMFKEAKAPANSGEIKKPAYNGPKRLHPMALASLILGIVSVIPYISILTGILAIVFGNIALRAIKANPDYYRGIGQARTGKIFGMIALALMALLVTIVIIGILFLTI